ncbi:MAG: OmpA family protein [Desulfobacterales bacterium]|nr:OmpA family protein [Desulfobacterales bacterium]
MKSKHISTGIFFLAAFCLFLNAGCQKKMKTSYFGVEEKALLVPRYFEQTEKVIDKAKESSDSVYQERKINDAMKYGNEAAIVYWACYDKLAEQLLALSRKTAYDAMLYHPQPPPPTPRRMASLFEAPEPPESLDPGPPFAGLKALPPRMILGTVKFEFDIYKLDAEAKGILNKNAPILNDISNYILEIAGHEIAGHTDMVGSDAYNQQLSDLRASTVLYYLASKGVPPFKMFPQGYGESELLDSTPTDEAQTKNRRAEVRIFGSMLPEFPVTRLGTLPAGTTIEIINFNYNDAKLLPVYETVLDKLLPAIQQSPNLNFELAGYTDAGESGKTADLTSRRVNNVREYLASKGISPSRFKTGIHTDRNPLASPDSSIGRKLNRRVEIKILP